MTIFAVDDEPKALRVLCRAIAEAAPDAWIRKFDRPQDVIAAVEGGEVPDVLFSDANMPGMSGVELAKALKKEKNMRFPNAFSGVKKIWLAEILMLLAAVIGIILIFVIAANGTLVGEDEIVINEAAKTPISILGIVSAVVALVAFVLNLVGLIIARKDDSGFRIALLVTVLGIIASAVSAIWSTNAGLVKWMDTLTTIFSMFASYYVLTGIANLADQIPDAATKALALKSRTLVEGSFCATVIFKLIISIFKIPDGSTLYTILSIVALLLELVSYILYLRALSKGKKMLAK